MDTNTGSTAVLDKPEIATKKDAAEVGTPIAVKPGLRLLQIKVSLDEAEKLGRGVNTSEKEMFAEVAAAGATNGVDIADLVEAQKEAYGRFLLAKFACKTDLDALCGDNPSQVTVTGGRWNAVHLIAKHYGAVGDNGGRVVSPKDGADAIKNG